MLWTTAVTGTLGDHALATAAIMNAHSNYIYIITTGVEFTLQHIVTYLVH